MEEKIRTSLRYLHTIKILMYRTNTLSVTKPFSSDCQDLTHEASHSSDTYPSAIEITINYCILYFLELLE